MTPSQHAIVRRAKALLKNGAAVEARVLYGLFVQLERADDGMSDTPSSTSAFSSGVASTNDRPSSAAPMEARDVENMVDWDVDDPRIAAAERTAAAQPATPTADQRAIVMRAIQQARAAGLELPRFRLRFVEGPDACWRVLEAETPELFLGIDAPDDHLRHNALHELCHAADWACGHFSTWSRDILENRAREFARWVESW